MKSDDFFKNLGCVSAMVGGAAVYIMAVIWGGWVLSVVWNWFMPVIFGLPYLTVVEAMTVSLLVRWLTQATVRQEKDEGSKNKWQAIGEALGIAFLTPLFMLVVAFILRLFYQ